MRKTVVLDFTGVEPDHLYAAAQLLPPATLRAIRDRRPDWQLRLTARPTAVPALAGLYRDAAAVEAAEPEGGDPGGDLVVYPVHGRPPPAKAPVLGIVHDLLLPAFLPVLAEPDHERRLALFGALVGGCTRLLCPAGPVQPRLAILNQGIGIPIDAVDAGFAALAPADPAAERALLSQLELAAEGYLFCPLGNAGRHNPVILLIAAGLWFRQRPDSGLKIVCAGFSDPLLERHLALAVERMGLAGRVVAVGGLTDPAAIDMLLRRCRAVLLPSLDESFSVPVAAAVGLGKPVLHGEIAALRQIAGDAALTFDPRRPEQIVAAIAELEEGPAVPSAVAAAAPVRPAGAGLAEVCIAAFEAAMTGPPVPVPAPVPPPRVAAPSARLAGLGGALARRLPPGLRRLLRPAWRLMNRVLTPR